MATKQSDFDVLTGILERFDRSTVRKAATDVLDESVGSFAMEAEELTDFESEAVQKAITELIEGVRPRKYVRDLPDPGPEVEPGTDNVQFREDVDYLERIIAEPNLLPVHFLDEGAAVQKAVARVTLLESYHGLPAGSGWGTGFLVSPSLFMTNHHVIEDSAFAHKVEMQFNYQLDFHGTAQAVDAFSTNPDSFFHTNSALDYTLVRLNSKPLFSRWPAPWQMQAMMTPDLAAASATQDPVPAAARLRHPVVPNDWLNRWHVNAGQRWGHLQLTDSIGFAGPAGDLPGTHLNIIQHPRGRRKEVALQRNNITNIYPSAIRYTTDTEPGSSGSPVFNNAWDLLAIHHAAGTRDPVTMAWLSNEGMRMDKIVADLRNEFSGTPDGQAILGELGI